MLVAVALAALAAGVTTAQAGSVQSPCVITGPQWVLDNGMAGAQHKVIKGTRYSLKLSVLGRASPPTCSFARTAVLRLLRMNEPTGKPYSMQKLVGGPAGFTCRASVPPPPSTAFPMGTCERYQARANSRGGDGQAFVWNILSSTA